MDNLNENETKAQNTGISATKVIWVLILVAGTVGLIFSQRLIQQKSEQELNTQPVQPNDQPVVKVVSVDKTHLPEGLPASLPLENDVEILRNEKLTTEKNDSVEVQSRRTFISNRSLEENKTIYSDYLKQNGWEVADSASPDDITVLIGQKDGGEQILRIVISKLTAPPGADIALTGSEVDITLTEIKTK